MSLRVYNTLTNKKEDLEPVTPGKIGMYLCGPTVYKPSHIGHMVGPVIFDVVKRHLVYCGYDVTFVVNVTDIDDKLIVEAAKRDMTVAALAEEMTADYMNNLSAMGIDTIDHFPRATDNMQNIIDFISGLIEKGYAYESDGDVYFDVGKDAEYGKLSNRRPDDMQGEGGGTATRKRSPLDFALWKSAKPGEPTWESPWAPGRPGWHIECSAMSKALLGETFDFHGGGLDLVFPHHENEVAQSECLHGKPQANYWLHNGLMQAPDEVGKLGGRNTRTREEGEDDGQLVGDQDAQEAGKMGKSKGASAFSALLERHPAEAIRLLLISTHYRSPILFSEDEIRASAERLETFYRFFKRYERVTGDSFYELPLNENRDAGDKHLAGASNEATDFAGMFEELSALRQNFLARMDDDFNTAAAIGNLYEALGVLNRFIEEQKLEGAGKTNDAAQAALRNATITFRELAGILGLFRQPPQSASGANDEFVDQLMQLLIQIRADARKAKNFDLADTVRNQLTEIGVTLEDRADGTTWELKR